MRAVRLLAYPVARPSSARRCRAPSPALREKGCAPYPCVSRASAMHDTSSLGKILRGVALTLVLLFFMFPIVWILLMSFQTNDTILRIPPSLFFEPTLTNYKALI